MTHLPYNKMPISFTGQALLAGATSYILNPPNSGQSVANIVIGKPVRAVARLIYQVAIAVIAPFGVGYHWTMAAYHRLCDRKEVEHQALAWEHFKAGLTDLISLATLGARTPFFLQPNSSVSYYTSASLVKASHLQEYQLAEAAKWLDNNKHWVEIRPVNDETGNEQLNQMKDGLYRFDELIHRALVVREVVDRGIMHSLDAPGVHLHCAVASLAGIYGY
jgi:hypothetical protein